MDNFCGDYTSNNNLSNKKIWLFLSIIIKIFWYKSETHKQIGSQVFDLDERVLLWPENVHYFSFKFE